MKKRLTLLQMDVHVNDVEYNYNRVQELLTQSLAENPDIIVLPETWNTGFHPSDDLITIADRNGERTIVFNTSYAYNREGTLVGEYSKMHGFSPAKEDKYFASGTHATHFKLDGIPCSTVICYDIRFPELVRMAALPGTELLFVPAQWPTMRLRHWQVLNEV